MIEVYADGKLVYDSRVASYSLLALLCTTGLNKGGALTLTMPPGHPAYLAFTGYKTIVTVYKDKKLKFRGRAIYPSDDFYMRRTIVCEGERCFFRDAVMRPHLYQIDPATIFADVVAQYNAQVDESRRFVVGRITVTDPNDYIRFESSNAQRMDETLDRLIERCGGYITFTTTEDGRRAVNWLAELNYQASQPIEFRNALLNYQSTGSNTDLATVIFPYGAAGEQTGERITIASVNEGLDYIQDEDAVALRGWIAKPVFWDDVTLPENLLKKAKQHLADSKMFITTLNLTAIDLALVDKTIESYEVGDRIRVISKPHGINDYFLLQTKTEDLLKPNAGNIVLGKELATLTGGSVAGDKLNAGNLALTEERIKSDYVNAVGQAKQTLTSLIQQTSAEIRMEVSEQYATGQEIEEMMGTRFVQLADSFNFEFTKLKAIVDENDASDRKQFETIEKYIRFIDGNIHLGGSHSQTEAIVENTGFTVNTASEPVLTANTDGVNALNLTARQHLTIGSNSRFEDYQGGTACFFVGGNDD